MVVGDDGLLVTVVLMVMPMERRLHGWLLACWLYYHHVSHSKTTAEKPPLCFQISFCLKTNLLAQLLLL